MLRLGSRGRFQRWQRRARHRLRCGRRVRPRRPGDRDDGHDRHV